jgi:hypothetical protein
MTEYLIKAPHTKETCLQALDEVLEEGPEFLAEFRWGCPAGVHDGWAVVAAESESAVRGRVPPSQRDNWSITQVTSFTADQIRAAHQG